MVLSDNDKRKYIQRLLLARLRLLNNYSFYGLLLMNAKFSLDLKAETAYTDGSKICFSPKFMDELDDNELEFILMHELLHIVLKHCSRGKNYNNLLFNIACDIVVNSNILKSKNMDLSSITLKKYGESIHLAPNNQEGYNYTAEEVYEMLVSNLKSNPIFNSFDNHDNWESDDENSSEWDERMVSAVSIIKESKSHGDVPLGVLRAYDKLTNPQVNWKVILRDFMSTEINDYSFNPPDRRFDGPFFMPDFNGEIESLKLNLLVAIDTSSSVSNKAIGAALAEIKSIVDEADYIDGYIVCLDTVTYEPTSINDFDFYHFQPLGGGGTHFKAFFDQLDSLKARMSNQVDLIIFITDGYDDYPPEAVRQNIPVLWIINNDEVTPPWGMVARIEV